MILALVIGYPAWRRAQDREEARNDLVDLSQDLGDSEAVAEERVGQLEADARALDLDGVDQNDGRVSDGEIPLVRLTYQYVVDSGDLQELWGLEDEAAFSDDEIKELGEAQCAVAAEAGSIAEFWQLDAEEFGDDPSRSMMAGTAGAVACADALAEFGL